MISSVCSVCWNNVVQFEPTPTDVDGAGGANCLLWRATSQLENSIANQSWTVRHGSELATPARFPDADHPGSVPYLGGGFLFIKNVTGVAYHPYKGNVNRNIGVRADLCSAALPGKTSIGIGVASDKCT